MATYGFSLDPYSVSQRHCFHDSDEEDEGEQENGGREYFFFSQSSTKDAHVKLLIVCTSRIPVAFVKSHVILKPAPCCIITCQNSVQVLKGRYFSDLRRKEDSNNKEEEKVNIGELYEAEEHPDVLICFSMETLEDDYCNEWSRKLLNYCQPQFVVILHSLLHHEYYFTDEERDLMNDDRQFLRSLQTHSWTSASYQPLAPFLSCNNKLSGLPAAVLTHCQVSALPASLVNLYTSSALTDKEQIQGFRAIFSHSLLLHSLSFVPLKLVDEKITTLICKPQHGDKKTLYT